MRHRRREESERKPSRSCAKSVVQKRRLQRLRLKKKSIAKSKRGTTIASIPRVLSLGEISNISKGRYRNTRARKGGGIGAMRGKELCRDKIYKYKFKYMLAWMIRLMNKENHEAQYVHIYIYMGTHNGICLLGNGWIGN